MKLNEYRKYLKKRVKKLEEIKKMSWIRAFNRAKKVMEELVSINFLIKKYSE